MQGFFENGAGPLDDGKRKQKKKPEKKDKKPMKCPKCFQVHDPRPTCPHCGYQYPRQSFIEHEAGELIALSGGPAATRDQKQDIWSQLQFVLKDRGYNPGWAANKFKERFGVWPRGLVDTEKEPSTALLNWLRSRQIAYAKGRKSREEVTLP